MDVGKFIPGDRHGDRGAGEWAEAVNGVDGFPRQVLQVVDIYFRSPGLDRAFVGGQIGEDADYRLTQPLDKGGGLFESIDWSKRQIKMEPGGPGKLGEDLQAQVVAELFNRQGNLFRLF